MQTSEPVGIWSIVKVPYPYTDRPVRQHRPALVIAVTGQGSGLHLLWVLMITSAENRGWTGDVDVPDTASAGLPAPSVVRTAKIATIDARDAQPLGRLPEPDRASVRRQLGRMLAPALDGGG